MHYHAFCTESAQIPLLSFTLKPFCYLIFAWLNWARSLFICLRQMKTFSSFAGASIGVALTLEFELQTSHSTSYLHYATFPCELISPAPEISTIRWPIQHINIQSIIFFPLEPLNFVRPRKRKAWPNFGEPLIQFPVALWGAKRCCNNYEERFGCKILRFLRPIEENPSRLHGTYCFANETWKWHSCSF